MTTGQIRGGLCYIKADGQQFDCRADAKYNVGGFTREAVVGMDGIHGYTESNKVSYIEGLFSDAGDLDTKAFKAMTNVTVTLELANGKQVILRNAWCQDAVEVDAVAGSYSLRFEAPSGEEVTTSGNQ